MGIAKKIQLLIKGGSINKWAEDHGLPPQTVHEWIKNDRMPRESRLKELVDATGLPEQWWRYGENKLPPEYNENNKAKPLVTSKQQTKSHDINDHVPQPVSLADFIFVPQYDVKASAGHGSVIHSEQIVDYLAFKKCWVKSSLGCSEKNLALITIKGDSMEPTLSSEDLILVNLGRNQINDNAVYVLQFDGSLLVKRIQRLMNGSVIIKSDNPSYKTEEISAEQARLLNVLGVVVWYGRKM